MKCSVIQMKMLKKEMLQRWTGWIMDYNKCSKWHCFAWMQAEKHRLSLFASYLIICHTTSDSDTAAVVLLNVSTRGPSSARIARDDGSSSTNRCSDGYD